MTFDVDWVRAQLPGRRIDWHETISSTMPEAARLAAEGQPSGTAVVAGEQTAGHGRYGRTWHSEPDSGLYVSVILRHKFTPENVSLTTMALGLAVAEAILHTTGITCDLRW